MHDDNTEEDNPVKEKNEKSRSNGHRVKHGLKLNVRNFENHVYKYRTLLYGC